MRVTLLTTSRPPVVSEQNALPNELESANIRALTMIFLR